MDDDFSEIDRVSVLVASDKIAFNIVLFQIFLADDWKP